MVKQFISALLGFLLLASAAPAQTKLPDLRNDAARQSAVRDLLAESVRAQEHAWAIARGKGLPVQGRTADGRGWELIEIDTRGRAVYYVTENVNAAISTNVHQIRNIVPYSLSGAGLKIGLWDEAGARPTHQELTGRVTLKDGTPVADHSTHVAGTLGASGVQANALGMAPSILIDSYNWTSDYPEMVAAAAASPGQAGRIYLSNHSYGTLAGWEQGNYSGNAGFHWFGGPLEREDFEFGRYSARAHDWDDLCYSAPYYLPFKSTGNDRDDPAPTAGTTFYYQPIDGVDVWSSRVYFGAMDPFPDGYKGGYDTIPSYGNAKNIVTVGAIDDAVSGGVRSLPNGTMASFSGWGPTDDGRIKPDVVGNGLALYSCISASDNAYANYNGTSMSTPNVAGTAALLVEYYNRLFTGSAMRNSTLKGLLIHTADNLGNPGPDYQFGWGLINGKAAADHITAQSVVPADQHMVESQLSTGTPTRSYSLYWDGFSPIKATLCWSDPAANPLTDMNNPSLRLINDLDVRVEGPGPTTYLPYVLDPANPGNAATTGDNVRDNVEQVYLAAPGASGAYVVQVSYKGTLTGSSQDFSLLLSGLVAVLPTPTPTPTPTNTGTPTPTPTLAPPSASARWFPPELVALPANSGAHALVLRLSDYVQDDNTLPQFLTFTVVSQTAPSVVAINTSYEGVVSANVQPNQTGKNTVVFRVRDASGNTTDAAIDFFVMGATGVREDAWRRLE